MTAGARGRTEYNSRAFAAITASAAVENAALTPLPASAAGLLRLFRRLVGPQTVSVVLALIAHAALAFGWRPAAGVHAKARARPVPHSLVWLRAGALDADTPVRAPELPAARTTSTRRAASARHTRAARNAGRRSARTARTPRVAIPDRGAAGAPEPTVAKKPGVKDATEPVADAPTALAGADAVAAGAQRTDLDPSDAAGTTGPLAEAGLVRSGAGSGSGRAPILLPCANPCDGFFPAPARADHAEVRVAVEVDVNGRGHTVHVLRVRPVAQSFDRAARACAARLRFSPARDAAGAAVPGRALLALHFDRD